MSPNVNYGLCVIMCRCRFISCDKHTTQVRILIVEEEVSSAMASLLFAQFCCDPKVAVKIKVKEKCSSSPTSSTKPFLICQSSEISTFSQL